MHRIDYNLDGHLDLYVANWGTPGRLYMNSGSSTGVRLPGPHSHVRYRCPSFMTQLGDRCLECPRNIIADNGGQCTFSCPAGFTRDVGQVECSSCPAGTAYNTSAGICELCSVLENGSSNPAYKFRPRVFLGPLSGEPILSFALVFSD